MAQLAAWLVIAAAISYLNRYRPVGTVAIAFAVWALIPATAAHRVVGAANGPLAAHPATWLVLMQLAVCVLSDVGVLARALERHVVLTIMIPIFSVAAVVTSIINESGGLRLLLDQVVGPAAAFLLVVVGAQGRPDGVGSLRFAIIVLAVIESLLAFVQSSLGDVIFFASDFEKLYWFNPERFDRWMGTTDSPLVLSLLIVVATPLTIGLRSTPIRLGALLAMVLGVVTSQSRIGVAIVAFLLVYFVVRGQMSLPTRLVALFCVLFGARSILQSDLVSGISSRVSNDTGSSAARQRAFDLFVSEAHSVAWVGRGLTSNYQVATDGGLVTSFESSFLMYAIDVGLPLAVLYFGTQLALVFWHRPRNRINGAFLAALFGVLSQHTFSALAFSNLTGFVVWCAIAIEVVGSSRDDEVAPQVHAPARRRDVTSAAV